MTPAEIECISVGGRCIKPVAIGPVIATLVLFLNQILALLPSTQPILFTPDDSLGAIAVLAGLSSVFTIWAWFRRSQIMYEIGLLFGVGAWAGRAVEVALDGTSFQGILPMCFAITMAGLYVLETSHRELE